MNKFNLNIIISVFLLIFLSLSSSGFASPVITWYTPAQDAQYYWDNFFLNISTDINTNCTYQIVNITGGTVVVPYTLMNGTNSTWHNASIDVEALVPGYRYNITVNCTNSTDATESNESAIWFYRDYECGDTVHDSWVLGHDLDCSGTALNIGSDHIVFDCNSHTLKGITTSTTYGFNIVGISSNYLENITIKNCNISEFYEGIYGIYVNNLTLINNTILNSNFSALHLNRGKYHLIKNNTFFNISRTDGYLIFWYATNESMIDGNIIRNSSSYGVFYQYSENNIFVNNTIIYNAKHGVYSTNSPSIVFYRNKIYGNNPSSGEQFYVLPVPTNGFELSYNQQGNYWGYNLCPAFEINITATDNVIDHFPYKSPDMNPSDQCLVCGVTLHSSYTLQNDMNCSWYDNTPITIDTDNVVFDGNGKRIVGNVSASVSVIRVYNADNVTVKNCNISNSRWGIDYYGSDNGKILNNMLYDIGTATGQYDAAIYIHVNSNDNYIYNNTIYNGRIGIFLYSTNTGNVIENNKIYESPTGLYGIYVGSESNNTQIINNIINHTQIGMLISSSGNISIYNNQISYSTSVGVRFSNTDKVNMTNNNVTDNPRGIEFYSGSPSQIMIYKNRIYGNTMNVYSWLGSGVQIFLDYNGMGNYWGYSGNTCPGFRPGVDSNLQNVIDRYPYNDMAFTDYACDCGDIVNNNVTLYRDITCFSSHGLIINHDHITLNCNNRWISSNRSFSGILTAGASTFSDITILNCNLNSTLYGVGIYHTTNLLINNSKFYNSTDGIYLKNVTSAIISYSDASNNTYSVYFENVTNANMYNLDIYAGYGNVNWGMVLRNSSNITISSVRIRTKMISTAVDNAKGIYLQNSSHITLYNVNVTGDGSDTGFMHSIYALDIHNSTFDNVLTNNSYYSGIYLQDFSYVTISNSTFANKFVGSGNDGIHAVNGNDLTITNTESYSIVIDSVDESSIINTSMISDNYNQSVSISNSNNVTVNGGSLNRITFANTNNSVLINVILNNTCPSSSEHACSRTVILSNSHNITITQNDIIYNYQSGVIGLSEASCSGLNIINNYWGHDECPLFLYYRDTDSQTFYDHAPWNSSHMTTNCAPQYKGVKIYKTLDFSKTIDRNESNIFYYYYNNSRVLLEFQIIPSNFIVWSANLTHNGNVVATLQPANANRTIWRANFTLVVNLSDFTTDGSYPWNFTFSQPGYEGPISTFLALININPINNYSVAYDPSFGGSTTNWSTIEDFSNVTNLTFESPGLGKIVILGDINLLDPNFIQALVMFGDYMKIANRSMYMNSSAFKILNKTSLISMYGINTSYTASELGARILLDGAPCPSSICSGYTYNSTSREFTFQVSHWSNYTLDIEAPVILSTSPSGTISQTTATLTVTTNENATCKYDTSDKDYWAMNYVMTSDSSGTTHTATVSGLTRGAQYTYYVRCKDMLNNTNDKSSIIQFSVATLPQEGETKEETPAPSKYIGELEEGKKISIKLYKSTKLSFKLKDTGEYHYLSVQNVYEDRAIFVIESDPVILELTKGETKMVDIDNDGYYDIKLTLNDIVGNYVYFDMEYIHEKVPEEVQEEEIQPPQPPQPPEKEKEVPEEKEIPIQPEKEIPQQPQLPEEKEKPKGISPILTIGVFATIILAALFYIFVVRKK